MHSKDFDDQTGCKPRLIWVFAGCTSFCWFCSAPSHFVLLVSSFRWSTDGSRLKREAGSQRKYHRNLKNLTQIFSEPYTSSVPLAVSGWWLVMCGWWFAVSLKPASCTITRNKAYITLYSCPTMGLPVKLQRMLRASESVQTKHWQPKNCCYYPYMSHIMRKPVYAICEQQSHKSACTSVQSDQHLCCSLPG